MYKVKRVIVLGWLLLVCSCQKPPDFVDVFGHGHRFGDFSGKWVIVNYWATWCGPCLKEIPELNRLASLHRDRLVVLGVNYDGPTGDEMREQVRKMRIDFTVLAKDPVEKLGITEPDVLPTTFVFAPGLVLRKTLVGAQTEASILAVVDQPSS